MEYSTLKSAIGGNVTPLLRELLKYDKENVKTLLFKCDWDGHFIREFTEKHKVSYREENQAAVKELFEMCFELDYDPMRPVSYNPYLEKWGKSNTHSEKYSELVSIWFNLSDTNKVSLLKYIGQEKIQATVNEGFHLLHQAFKEKNYETISLLSQYGIDFNQKDNFGKTPKDYAQEDPKGLDLYLKLNPIVDEDIKFNNLKKWFVDNISKISTSKYSKAMEIEKLHQWINEKWETFTLSQKQEIFSLSIGAPTKDIFTYIGKKVDDRKTLLNPKFPFWLALDNCSVKQLGYNALKNVPLTQYNEANDVYFIEKLSDFFEKIDLNKAMGGVNLNEDESKLKFLAESYFNYKDIWLQEVNGKPLLHHLAQRKNSVFETLGQYWLNFYGASDFLSHSNGPTHHLEDNHKLYLVKRFEKTSMSPLTVLNIPIEQSNFSTEDVHKKTWLFKDEDNKYTIQYFLENHYRAITYNYIPKVLESLMNNLSEFYKIYGKDQELTEAQQQKLLQRYQQISSTYTPEIIFAILESSSIAHHNMLSSYGWGFDKSKPLYLMRICHNILSLDEYKNEQRDYSRIKLHKDVQELDPSLYQQLNSLMLQQRLSTNLENKDAIKRKKI